MSCWDSSALAKLFLPEPDSADFRARAIADMPLLAAHLARHELATTFRRKEAEGLLKPGAAEVLRRRLDRFVAGGRIILKTETPALTGRFDAVIESCFSANPPVFVRTADAIHIATALAAGETEFVTADVRQKKAAEVCGLTVQPSQQ